MIYLRFQPRSQCPLKKCAIRPRNRLGNYNGSLGILPILPTKRFSTLSDINLHAAVKKELPSLDSSKFGTYDPKVVESDWYNWWEQQGFFKPEFTSSGEIKPEGIFCIPAPPPNVTGSLHIGHALTIAIQDSLVRYNRMKGKTVLFLPGFDHAGIATQSVVEKQIFKSSGKTKYDYGRKAFVDEIWNWKNEYHKRIKKQIKMMGGSYDWTKEAFTLDPNLSKAVSTAFIKLFDEGIIYRDTKLINWSVKLRTAISNLEVDNVELTGKTYIDVPGYSKPIEFGVMTSIAYPVLDSQKNERIVISTTRPETLFGDTAIAVHPDDDRYKHLHGKFVQHPLLKKKLPIICDKDIVDMKFGTGVVKITPAHDYNDYKCGKRNNLEFVNILTDDGLLNAACGERWQGMKRFDARSEVIKELKSKHLFVSQHEHPMTIPICSRSGDVIEPILKPQWWVSQKEMAKEAISVVKDGKITINPKHSESEYFRWLENIDDWCISRQLWWGHRCPVYFVKVEGSPGSPSDQNYWVAAENIEKATIKAKKKFPNSKFSLIQDEDVLDTWFSSGLWPFSILGWPENTKDMKDFYPFSLLETGWDILFFWVTRMIILGTKLTGQIPFREVFCHPLIRDSDGRKMSKSLGNVIDPVDVINGATLEELGKKLYHGNLPAAEIQKAIAGQKKSYPKGIPQCGADALRFTLCSYTSNDNSNDISLAISRVETFRKFCNKIYQATKFLLARLPNGFVPPKTSDFTGNETIQDKWILTQLSLTSQIVNDSFEQRDFMKACNEIYKFWYLICDNYIEYFKFVSTRGNAIQLQSAERTIYLVFDSALRLIHPIMPFISEELWQRLPKLNDSTQQSICVEEYPVKNENSMDLDIWNRCNTMFDAVRETRSLMNQYNLRKNCTIYLLIKEGSLKEEMVEQELFLRSLFKSSVSDIHFISEISPSIKSDCVSGAVTNDVSVYLVVKGHIKDVSQEISKNKKKISKLEKTIFSIQKSMKSEDYQKVVSKKVQNLNNEVLKETLSKIASLNTTIENLSNFLEIK